MLCKKFQLTFWNCLWILINLIFLATENSGRQSQKRCTSKQGFEDASKTVSWWFCELLYDWVVHIVFVIDFNYSYKAIIKQINKLDLFVLDIEFRLHRCRFFKKIWSRWIDLILMGTKHI